jgi:hypothetical protein
VLWRLRLCRSVDADYGTTRWHVTHTVGNVLSSAPVRMALRHPFATYRHLTEPGRDADCRGG